jgi:alpha-N-arabinofuranosidase
VHYWQQNTLRDALVAAITLNTFNNHADVLVMCNIAQTVNVLQAMCLTEGDKMILTPTYHVFDLYQDHKDGRALRVEVESPTASFAVGNERRSMPVLSASASVKNNVLTLSLTNAHATLPQEVEVELRGVNLLDVQSRVLTDDEIAAHNTFDQPNQLAPRPTTHTSLLPAASVTVLRGRLEGHAS